MPRPRRAPKPRALSLPDLDVYANFLRRIFAENRGCAGYPGWKIHFKLFLYQKCHKLLSQ